MAMLVEFSAMFDYYLVSNIMYSLSFADFLFPFVERQHLQRNVETLDEYSGSFFAQFIKLARFYKKVETTKHFIERFAEQ